MSEPQRMDAVLVSSHPDGALCKFEDARAWVERAVAEARAEEQFKWGVDAANYGRQKYEQGQRDERARWDAVRNAWLIEGPRPDYHREAKRELMRRWPTLVRALSAVIDPEVAS